MGLFVRRPLSGDALDETRGDSRATSETDAEPIVRTILLPGNRVVLVPRDRMRHCQALGSSPVCGNPGPSSPPWRPGLEEPSVAPGDDPAGAERYERVPRDDGLIEPIHGFDTTERLPKTGWLRPDRTPSRSLSQAEVMASWIEAFSNRTRRHSSLGMISPVAFEKLQPNKQAPPDFSQCESTISGREQVDR